MERKLRLYPTVKVTGQDFSKVKKVTVPAQALTLKEILKRFVRRESVAVERDGMYADHLGDLEKMQHEDITVRMERAQELKQNIEKAKARMKKKEEDEKAAKEKFEKDAKDRAPGSPAPDPAPAPADKRE